MSRLCLIAQEHVLPASERRMVARRRRANRMMVAMLCSFVLAWLPMNILNIIRDFDLLSTLPQLQQMFYLLFAVAHCVAMMACVCNPMIYSWFNESFR